MIPSFVHSFQSEWLKKKRSAAVWLVMIGGFFIPAIMLIARFNDFNNLATHNGSPQVWEMLYKKCWQFMGLFLLPMGVIMATSLITQIEFRNNTWKQVHATPQKLTNIFFSKLLVILTMMMQFFILFNLGIYLTGIIPALLFKKIPFPNQSITLMFLIKQNLPYFISCLPVIGFQYLIGLQFKNFLVSIGAGLGLLVAALIAIPWKFGYIIPYVYSAYTFLASNGVSNPLANIQVWAIGYFILFIVVGYILYINRREKG